MSTFSSCTSNDLIQDIQLSPTTILQITQYISGLTTTHTFLKKLFGGNFIGDLSGLARMLKPWMPDKQGTILEY
jgi:hypothetical protein